MSLSLRNEVTWFTLRHYALDIECRIRQFALLLSQGAFLLGIFYKVKCWAVGSVVV